MKYINKDKVPEALNYRKLLIKTLVGLAILMLIFILIGMTLSKSMLGFLQEFIKSYGYVGLFTGFYLTAISLIPLPDHALSAFAQLGGMGFWPNVIASTAGSVAGAVTAYAISGAIKNTKLYNKWMKPHHSMAEKFVSKYGGRGLALVCLSPLPDAPVFWICGAYRYPFARFFWILLICRCFKIIYVLWFIRLGT